jgi:parallel beta-helix repeat protein
MVLHPAFRRRASQRLPGRPRARRRPALVIGTALSIALTGLTWFGEGTPPASADTECIASGTDADITAALVGAGAVATLCPGAVFNLAKTVYFTAAQQRIETKGLPTDATRAKLRIASSTLALAVYGHDQSGAVLQSVEVDGSRPQYGRASDALIEMGGNGTGQKVRNIYAHHTRGWSNLHLFGGDSTGGVSGCQLATVSGNLLTDAGTDAPNRWADGISLDCGNTLVENNTIRDATDGGIVIFGAAGSTVRNNTIIASTQELLGGINMVDHGPEGGNYTGTTVTGNVIDARGAFIKVAVGMGPTIWGCGDHSIVNYGATVTGNTLKGDLMGYGFAVNGVRDWTVTGNTDASKHVGLAVGNCATKTSTPAGFQYDWVSSSTLQSDFRSGALTGLLDVTSPQNMKRVSLRSRANGKYVTAENAGASPLIADRTAVGSWETFELIDRGDGTVALFSYANSTLVTSDPNGNPLIANRYGIGPWETFTRVNNSDGSISLIAGANGKLVCAEAAGASPLIANRTAIGSWEKFDPVPVTLAGWVAAESYTTQAGTQKVNNINARDGVQVGYIDNGDWLAYAGTNVSGKTGFTARVASGSQGGTIQIRTGSPTGPILGSLTVPHTGGYNTFTELSTPINPGTGALQLVFTGSGTGGLLDIDDFTLTSSGNPPGEPSSG